MSHTLKRKFTQPTGGAVESKKARVAKAMKKKVTSMTLLREVKYQDNAITVSSITTTPQVFSLSDIAQGDNYNNRNGNLVQAKYIQYEFCMKQVGGGLPIVYKLAIVLDRQVNGISPNYSDVYDTAVAPLVCCMKNIKANQERFKILVEHYGVMVALGADGTEGKHKGFINLQQTDLRDQIIRWGSTGAAAPQTNGYYVMFVTDTTVANQAAMNGLFRLAFNEN